MDFIISYTSSTLFAISPSASHNVKKWPHEQGIDLTLNNWEDGGSNWFTNDLSMMKMLQKFFQGPYCYN